MLVLSRKVGEEIIIGDNIRVTVVAVRPNVVRLGFTAPDNVPIFRAEICPTEVAEPERERCHVVANSR